MARPGRDSSAATAGIRTQDFLRRQLWIWPLLAAAVLAFVGVWVRARMEGAMRAEIAGNLQTIRDANVEALRAWAAAMKSQAELLAEDDDVRALTAGLLRRARQQGISQTTLAGAPEFAALQENLKPAEEGRGFSGYAVLDTNLVVLAAARQEFAGAKISARVCRATGRPVSRARPMVTPPFAAPWRWLPDEPGRRRARTCRLMFAAAPVRSADGKVIAVLALRIPPEKDFTRILATARAGASGETYAFNRTGVLLSESRFDDELKRLGLIPDAAETRSTPDPGAARSAGGPDAGHAPAETPGRAALDASRWRGSRRARRAWMRSGYRDYRGVPVVGAWTVAAGL